MRYIFSVAVFIIDSHSDRPKRVLLCHHKRFGMWVPVGGEIEDNETPLAAAIREVKEETGIELHPRDFPESRAPGTPRGFIGYDEHPAGVKDGQETVHMNLSFKAVAPTMEVEVCDEHNELLWLTLQDVRARAELKEMPPNVWYHLRNNIWRLRA